MYKRIRFVIVTVLLLVAMSFTGDCREMAEITGQWTFIPDESSEIGLYGTLSIEIMNDNNAVTVIQKWGSGRSFSDTVRIKPDDKFVKFPIKNRVFPSNVFMGLSKPVGESRQIKAIWKKEGQALKLEEKYEIVGSQGKSPITSIHTYQLSDDEELLIYEMKRSTRTTGPEVKYVFKRAGTKIAYYMNLEDDWEVRGGLAKQAFMLSMQGIVNADAPNLYFIYPPNYPYTYTASVFDYYKKTRYYTFNELKTTEQALNTFKDKLKGYVVWDKNERTSLIVAFTVAGLEKAIVVSEELIPLVEKAGLKMVEDFRGKFTGQTDAQIYQWAYDKYWDRCNKEFIVWMGGDAGDVMKPGVADWGIYKKVFFNDLSTVPEDKEEYALANKVLSEMKPMSYVMGWHSYAKDKERDHVKLTSNYGHVVEGLHTLPNFSFSSQIPFTKGFKIINNHHIEPSKKYIPENKIYIACVQTDGLGIGAWLKPGRGEIPYAWEVIMNYVWMAPGMLEYFYSMATPNDYFIGCLSGPGYMYPKAVPEKYLPKLIARAQDLMNQLDLKIFETMDYSEGATVEGNTELTEKIVDAYYKNMPDAIGFLNGYAPAYTFAEKGGRPFISYDYYLSPTRPEDDAVADLKELAEINKQRPYFLLIHVRESSDVKRVIGILNKLGPDFEVVHLDQFVKMAGEKPTFKEKFLKK